MNNNYVGCLWQTTCKYLEGLFGVTTHNIAKLTNRIQCFYFRSTNGRHHVHIRHRHVMIFGSCLKNVSEVCDFAFQVPCYLYKAIITSYSFKIVFVIGLMKRCRYFVEVIGQLVHLCGTELKRMRKQHPLMTKPYILYLQIQKPFSQVRQRTYT